MKIPIAGEDGTRGTWVRLEGVRRRRDTVEEGTIQLTGSGAAETGTERSAGGQARVVSGQGGVHVLTVA